MKKWNKKGMMDDFFDFIFTTVSLFFLLFFISLVFNGSVNSSHETSAENVADFKIKDAAINNLLLQEVNIDKIDSSISKSNLWNGKVITSCTDYTTEKDCESDPMGKGGGFCNWASSFCYYGNPAIMVG